MSISVEEIRLIYHVKMSYLQPFSKLNITLGTRKMWQAMSVLFFSVLSCFDCDIDFSSVCVLITSDELCRLVCC